MDKVIAFYDNKKNTFTNTKIVSIFANVEHRAVKQIINTHKDDFLNFGKLELLHFREYEIKEIENNFYSILPCKNNYFQHLKCRNSIQGRPETFYLLNEEQATLLITYLKNTKQVREFKKALVKEFYKLKADSLKFKIEREKGKAQKKTLTDAINEWEHKNKYSFNAINDLILKKTTGYIARTLKKQRGENKTALDLLTLNELNLYKIYENIVISLLMLQISYKDIKNNLSKIQQQGA